MDWTQYIAVNSATAHPHYDSEGATYNMGNSYGKGGNRNALRALSASPIQPVPKINGIIVFAVGPTQVSSTTSSACLLLTPTQQRRTPRTWLELRWSAPSPPMNPGSPPTITASVSRSVPSVGFMYSGTELFQVALLRPAQPTCTISLWRQCVTFLCTYQLWIWIPTFISFTTVTHGCLSVPVFLFALVSSLNFTQKHNACVHNVH